MRESWSSRGDVSFRSSAVNGQRQGYMSQLRKFVPTNESWSKRNDERPMFRRKETATDRLWKYTCGSEYRGLLLVASIPIILILAVIIFMPRPASIPIQQHEHDFMPRDVGGTASGDASKGGAADAGATGQASEVYSIVLDAGSTGSRVHVFKFHVAQGELQLQSDTFEQLKPGLSANAEDPQKAAKTLQPLLDKALETVPAEQQASTKVELRATAGLRLLPGSQADNILAAVRGLLASTPFSFTDDAVTILGGEDEGAYAWLTLNYLLGAAGKEVSSTVSAIDMGGGSIQKAYAVDDAGAAARQVPGGEAYLKPLKAGGVDYQVYVHSYLGFGLLAGRAQALRQPGAAAACVPSGATGEYQYGTETFALQPAALGGSSSFAACRGAVQSALLTDAACAYPQGQCSLNGTWDGSGGAGAAHVFAASYFWDRGMDAGIITDPEAISHVTTASAFQAKAIQACSAKLDQLATLFPGMPAANAPYLCMDLSYAFSILTDGLKIAPDASITLVKRIQYNGQEIEAAWPLGAAVNSLSQ